MIILRIALFVATFLVGISLSDETLIRQNRPLPTFGRAMRQEFLMNSKFTFLNHAAMGTYPKVTRDALREYQDRAEDNLDLWVRRELRPELNKVRELLAKIVHASADDVVMILNTTTGMNSIFRSMLFTFGERILQFSTIFNSMRSIIQYMCDTSNGTVTALTFNVSYPISNDQIVKDFETFLQETHDPAHPIRIAVIDHITSVPGVIVPIERIIPLLKARNITVAVDGAHAIGQIPINITALAPDYYVTNCYKWLYAARGCSMMYADKKHQQTIHPANINSAYTHPSSFQNEFFWTGTMDYSPFLTVPAALKFREDVGGEEAIMSYNHRLAVDGGTYLANVFGTEILQDADQIANMVDVRLPIDNPNDPGLDASFWTDIQLYRFTEVFVPVNKLGSQWFIRISAQIYNDLNDFEEVGHAFSTICNEINGNNSTATILTASAASALVVYGAYSFYSGNIS